MSPPRHFNHTPTVEVLTVIHVSFVRGAGVDPDPVRVVDRYYRDDGRLIFEVDPTVAKFESDGSITLLSRADQPESR